MARRILVTGAGGFVGQLVLTALAEAGVDDGEVYPAVHRDDRSAVTHANAAAINIIDRIQTRAVIEAIRPTGVIHLAAIADPAQARADATAAWDVNFLGVLHVVEAALAVDPEMPIAFSGSSESYGAAFRLFDGPIPEDAPLMPLTPYAATKAAADVYLGQKSRAGANIFRFRPFNHSGPGQSSNFVTPAFASQIARIERGLQPPVINVGNLDVERDFLDGRDVARAYVSAVLAETPAGQDGVFNLATGAPIKIRALLEGLLALSATPIEVKVEPTRVRTAEIKTVSGDPGRATRRLGWSASTPLSATLSSVLDYWRKQVGK